MATKMQTVTLPSYWATALINDDFSGMTPNEESRCRSAINRLADDGYSIVSDVEDSDRFTWSYRLYDPQADCEGGSVMDYVALKTVLESR